MKTILLIEDNNDILENLTEYLELEGYKILITNNGKKGVELAIEFMVMAFFNWWMKKSLGHLLLFLRGRVIKPGSSGTAG
ncbi:MAG: response regulator, partial [Saprospiraceae bacterium]|nr:response regulator [Saprospiraceae bacterium]